MNDDVEYIQMLGGNYPVKTSPSKFHSIEDHNYWIRRNGVCPYCRIGSKPVHKTLIVEELNKG